MNNVIEGVLMYFMWKMFVNKVKKYKSYTNQMSKHQTPTRAEHFDIWMAKIAQFKYDEVIQLPKKKVWKHNNMNNLVWILIQYNTKMWYLCLNLSTDTDQPHPAGAQRERPDHHGPQQAQCRATAKVFFPVCHNKRDAVEKTVSC